MILNGALTWEHFQRHPVERDRCGSEALRYTFRKFRRFLIPALISVLLLYCLTMELLFLGMTALILSGGTCSAGLGGKLCQLCGKLSLPMYLFHWPVTSAVPHLTSVLWARVLLYYCGTLLIALLYVGAAAVLKCRISKRRKTT